MSIVSGETEGWTENDVAKFMESPLVKWVKTFKKSKDDLDIEELNDSIFLLEVLLTIDGGIDGELLASINRSTSVDRDIKLRNWTLLAKTLHRYYKDYLQQLILSSWPDVFAMTEDSDRGACLVELQKFLVLILGYAVQCDRKEDHIETIKSLDVETQQALVMHIQQVTEIPRNVLSLADENQVDPIMLSQAVQDLCRERLQNMERIVGLSTDEGSEVGDQTKRRLPSKNFIQHQSKEDIEYRKQIRALNEELEEKTKLLTETRAELCTVNSELSKTNCENLILSAEAKTARVYKDELDTMKEMAIQSEKYRKEVQKYKNVLADIDFYKTRLADLRKDNDLLLESKATMELQLASSNKRIDSIMDELALSQKNLENSNSEKAELKNKLALLAEENARLECEKSQMKGGLLASNISRFMSITSIDCLPPMTDSAALSQTRGNSISDEVNETLTIHLTRLQMENDELKMKLRESTDRYQDLQRNLEQLRRQQEEEFQKKLVAIQQQSSQQSVRNSKELTKEFEQKVLEIEQRSIKLKQKVSKDFQQKLSEMERQNHSLHQHIEELQKQIKFIEDTWNRDREMCAKLHGTNEDLLSERRQVRRGISLIRDSCHDQIGVLQTKANLIEKETNNLLAQTKKIHDLCDDSVGPSSPDSRSRHRQNSSSSDANDNQGLTKVCSHSNAVDMDASYRSDLSSSSAATRGSTLGREETPRRSNTIAASRSGEESRSRIQGIVTPLVRSTEKTPTEAGDPSNSTQKRTLPPDLLRERLGSTFSRNDKHRHTMPVKMSLDHRHSKGSSSKYYSPTVGGGHRGVAPPGSSYSRPPQMAPYGQHSYSASEKRHSSSSSSSRDYDDISHRSHLNNSTVSESRGLDKSRQKPHSVDMKNGEGRETKWQVSSYSEKTVIRTLESLALGDDESRCRALVDQIMNLQAQNHQLINKNADLQQKTQTTKAVEEKLSSLEERNLELEKENKKLKQIIDSFISYEPQSLYDKRTYQFNSSV